MKEPPPKPRTASQPDLLEVERALSVLQGKHPEHERLNREEAERRAARAGQQDAVATAYVRRSRKRVAVIAVGAVVAAAIVTAIVVNVRAELRRRDKAEAVVRTWSPLGFKLIESSPRGARTSITAFSPAGCILAATTEGAGAVVHLTTPAGKVEGSGAVLTCICAGAQVTADADVPKGGSVVLLGVETAALGGSRAFPFLPFEVGARGQTDSACAEASVDAWVDAKRYKDAPKGLPPGIGATNAPRPSPTLDEAAQDKARTEPRSAAFARVGFVATARVSAGAPFGVVEVPKDACLLVVPEGASGRARVRLKNNVTAVGPEAGNLAWCTSAETTVLVERVGDNADGPPLMLMLAPSARVGGLLGLRELTKDTELDVAATTMAIRGEDQGWNAKQALVASAVAEPTITVSDPLEPSSGATSRIVALSVDRESALLPAPAAGVSSFCSPAPDKATESICVFSGPTKWRFDGKRAVGLAHARLPFWLGPLDAVSAPKGLETIIELVTLARRLVRDGFEATSLQAVKELANGAEVLGRANEDAMVVFGLAPSPPWFFPYTDGPSWTLTGEPHVIAIEPLAQVVVKATRPLPPMSTRRTVVFRRRKR